VHNAKGGEHMKNVILLTIDTLRKDVLGCYGDKGLTPFIDSLQDRCIKFENAYAVGPYTQASFPGILTSSYYFDFGRTKGKCPVQRVLLSEVIKNKGISTAAFHSNAYLSAFFGWNRGWDEFYDSMDVNVSEKVPYIRAGEINQKISSWLDFRRKTRDTKPFFIWAHYMDVHEPYIPEQRFIKAVDPELFLTEDEMFLLFKSVLLKRDVSNKSKVEQLKKLYFAHVREVDAAVRELFTILKEYDCHNDTTIIITSDHGEEFGEHGGLSHDGKMYQELVCVPLLIYLPDLDKPLVSQAVVSNIDIPPTVAGLFGIAPSPAWQGQSLLPLSNYRSKGAYGEAIDKFGPREKGDEKDIYFYREGDMKIIYREIDDSWELYHLQEDPEEKNNIMGMNTIGEYLMKKIIPRVKRYEK
jgi:arylsulfatase A-like enzyme